MCRGCAVTSPEREFDHGNRGASSTLQFVLAIFFRSLIGLQDTSVNPLTPHSGFIG